MKKFLSVFCAALLIFAAGQMAVAKEKLVMWDVQTTSVLKEKVDSGSLWNPTVSELGEWTRKMKPSVS